MMVKANYHHTKNEEIVKNFSRDGKERGLRAPSPVLRKSDDEDDTAGAGGDAAEENPGMRDSRGDRDENGARRATERFVPADEPRGGW